MAINDAGFIVVGILVIVILWLYFSRKKSSVDTDEALEPFSVEKSVIAIKKMLAYIRIHFDMLEAAKLFEMSSRDRTIDTLRNLNDLARQAFPKDTRIKYSGRVSRLWMGCELIEIDVLPGFWFTTGSFLSISGLSLTAGLAEDWSLSVSGFMLKQNNLIHTAQSVFILYDHITDNAEFFTGLKEKLEGLQVRLEQSQKDAKQVRLETVEVKG